MYLVGDGKMNYVAHQDHKQMAHQHVVRGIAKAVGSHDHHTGLSVPMFGDKFWLSLALTIPVIFWSSDVQHWLGYTARSFPGSRLIAPHLESMRKCLSLSPTDRNGSCGTNRKSSR